MKLKVKYMGIATGGILIAILNHKDANKLDLHSGDRLKIKIGKREAVVIIDISESNGAVPVGKIGLFDEVVKKLNVKRNTSVQVEFTGKPESVKHIRDKLLGKKLSYKELYHITEDITHDNLTDIEKTYFIGASFIHGLDLDEVINLTKAMVNTGDRLKFRGVTLDKHCIGGVPNNRTSMIVVPIIAAAGLTIPKTSSRAITSPAGTADTMECLAKVELTQSKIKKIVKDVGGCLVHGGSINLAPADDKIIQVEHPLSIDAEGQLLASVMAKKYSVSANHVLIDIPMGPTTKINNKKQAAHLKKMFELVGAKLKMNVKVIVTDGTQPIGKGVGPLLESQDVMDILKNEPLAPKDLREKSLKMAAILFMMANKVSSERAGYKLAKEILVSGKAYAKMQELIVAQGKVPTPFHGKYIYHIKAKKSGKIKNIDCSDIAKIARMAGAPLDKGAGLYLHKKVGEKAVKGDILFTLYSHSSTKLKLAKDVIKERDAYTIK